MPFVNFTTVGYISVFLNLHLFQNSANLILVGVFHWCSAQYNRNIIINIFVDRKFEDILRDIIVPLYLIVMYSWGVNLISWF